MDSHILEGVEYSAEVASVFVVLAWRLFARCLDPILGTDSTLIHGLRVHRFQIGLRRTCQSDLFAGSQMFRFLGRSLFVNPPVASLPNLSTSMESNIASSTLLGWPAAFGPSMVFFSRLLVQSLEGYVNCVGKKRRRSLSKMEVMEYSSLQVVDRGYQLPVEDAL